jgi:hypothetical protein
MRARVKTLGLHRVLLFAFWYLALFPGRLGYDYALLARMVQEGESTAWWGANFYWMFKVLTFEGRHLFLMSLLGLSLLTYSLYYFINALPIKHENRKKAMTAIMLTPIYGFFGVTVSHDVFQVCGVLLISALVFRWRFENGFRFSQTIPIIILSIFCLLTTHTGIVIIASLVAFVFYNRERKIALLALVMTATFSIISNLGINEPSAETIFKDKVPKAGNALTVLMLVDLKCIAQHPDALITEAEWKVLERYSAKENWKTQTTCSNPDAMVAPLGLKINQTEIDRDLVRTFLSVVSRSPAIPFISHVQRSAVALPPPFFLPPTYQIPWNPEIPLGSGTNVALQSGPGVLHPSIDEPSLAKKVAYFAPLEIVAQALALIVNQASWFWGWGGLWLWPIYLFLILKFRIKKLRDLVILTIPTLLLHLSIFLVGPSSLPRYVMATIFQGLIFAYLLIVERKVNV